MKLRFMRTMELSLLLILLMASLGAVSSIGYKARESAHSSPSELPVSESNNRFLEYLNSPIQ